jgi:hypothetical protein
MLTAVKQHYLPRAYLRGWCSTEDGCLGVYRYRVPPGKLVYSRRSPSGIGYGKDIYSLGAGESANGSTGDGVETSLADNVDAHIGRLVDRVASLAPGLVTDPSLEEGIANLMLTFSVRHPVQLARGDRRSGANAAGR